MGHGSERFLFREFRDTATRQTIMRGVIRERGARSDKTSL